MQRADQSEALKPSFAELMTRLREEGKKGSPENGGTNFAGGLEDAKKVEVSEAREYFDGSDKKFNSEFTIDDQPEKAHSASFDNEVLDKSTTEYAGAPESKLSKTEEMHLKANLKHAVDSYNEIIAQAVRLQKDLEAKGGNNWEISKVKITSILEDTRLHDPRVPSSVKSRMLQDLKENLKSQDSKDEAGAYDDKLKEIEPANLKVSETLDSILAKTSDISDVEKIRLSMAGLVVEDPITLAHKQDWDAICINRKAQIEDQMVSASGIADETIGQPQKPISIIEQIDEIDEKDRPDSGAGDRDLLNAIPVSLSETNKEVNIATESQSTMEKPKFQEFANIGSDGRIISEDPKEHTEVDLSQKEEGVNLSSADIAGLKRGDGTTDTTGIVNLSRSDLENPLELSNPTHKIKERISALKEAPQVIDKSEFNFDEVTDIDNKSLGVSSGKTAEKNVSPEAILSEEPLGGDVNAPKEITKEIEKGPGQDTGTEIKSTENADNLDLSVKSDGPIMQKKDSLWKSFVGLIGLGKEKSITTKEIHDLEGDVIKTRSVEVEKEEKK